MPKYAALCLAALLLPAVLRADDPEPKPKAVKPREIVVAGLARGGGTHDAPTRIATAQRLAELVPDGQTRAAILKQVDFRKEHLLLFRWDGSGQDRLFSVPSKSGEAHFGFTYGLTTDDRPHVKLFAIPSRAKVKVTVKPVPSDD